MGRSRPIPACRIVFAALLLPGLLLPLSAAQGCCKRGVGVTVTKEVPHSKETISDIEEREKTSPLPPRGDIAIHPHTIPRAGSDNAVSVHPGDDNTLK